MPSDAPSYRHPSIFLSYCACTPAWPPDSHDPTTPSHYSTPPPHSSNAWQTYAAIRAGSFFRSSSPAPNMPAQPCTHIWDRASYPSSPLTGPPCPPQLQIASCLYTPPPFPPTPHSPVSPALCCPFPKP